MLDVLVVARGLAKFVWYRICGGQGRFTSAKSAWPGNAQYGKFWPEPPFPKSYAEKFGPVGGRSLRARCPLMAGTWLVETVLLYRQSNTPLGPGRRSSRDDEEKIRENCYVFIACSGFQRSFAISARQFVLHDVFVLADGALGPGKFV